MEKVRNFVHSVAHNDHVRRVFHTAWQAAGAALITGLLAAHSTADVKLVLTTALTAALAAVKALVVSGKA